MSRAPGGVARLIAIPISHYCEKARWALDRAEVPYVQQGVAQLLHRAVLARVKGGKTTPVLVTAAGEVIRGSEPILRYADEQLPPERRLRPRETALRERADAWVDRLDRDYGPPVRVWSYQDLGFDPKLAFRYGIHGLSPLHAGFLLLGYPVVKSVVGRYLGVDAARSQAALDVVWRFFDEVARAVEGGGYLVGDRLTSADLTFSALSAPAVLPRNYGHPLPSLHELSPEIAQKVRAFRDHPAGRFALRLYQHER
jgi:glutathione S-transferase